LHGVDHIAGKTGSHNGPAYTEPVGAGLASDADTAKPLTPRRCHRQQGSEHRVYGGGLQSSFEARILFACLVFVDS